MRRIRRKSGLPGLILVVPWVLASGVGLAQNPLRAPAVHAYLAHPVYQKMITRECLACHSTGLSEGVLSVLQKVVQRAGQDAQVLQAHGRVRAATPKAVGESPPAEAAFPLATGHECAHVLWADPHRC